MAFFPMNGARRYSSPPPSELGYAVGPMPPGLVDIAQPGDHPGRTVQTRHNRERAERDPRVTQPRGARPSSGGFNFAGSIFENIAVQIGNLISGRATGGFIRPFRPTPPSITTPVAQPEPTRGADRGAEHELQTGGRVTNVTAGGRARVEVETVRGTRSVEVELPFPEAGLPDRNGDGASGAPAAEPEFETSPADFGGGLYAV